MKIMAAYAALWNNKFTVLSVVVLFVGVLFVNDLETCVNNFINKYTVTTKKIDGDIKTRSNNVKVSTNQQAVPSKNIENDQNNLFTSTRLALFNGITKKKLYMAVLGSIFDVTKGRQHYEHGASYHFFIGKDGSRSLVTGDFNDESDAKDHVMDLPCSDIFTLINWKDTFSRKYKLVGFLIGRFYDENGDGTIYLQEFTNKINTCKDEKEMKKQLDNQYPPCNIEWNAEDGTKVWCSKQSGGVKRSWVGVPRQMYTPGVEIPKCVCLTDGDPDNAVGLFKEYKNCPNTSHTCYVK